MKWGSAQGDCCGAFLDRMRTTTTNTFHASQLSVPDFNPKATKHEAQAVATSTRRSVFLCLSVLWYVFVCCVFTDRIRICVSSTCEEINLNLNEILNTWYLSVFSNSASGLWNKITHTHTHTQRTGRNLFLSSITVHLYSLRTELNASCIRTGTLFLGI
jgi:hypothetical protein